MDNLFKGVVYLTEEQYRELKTNGTLTVGDISLTYDEDILYVTPDNITDLVNYHTSLIDQNIIDINSLKETVYNKLDENTVKRLNDLLTVIGVKGKETYKSGEDLIRGTNIIILGDDE